ncbi:MAG: hypothetical protein A3H28_01435 [Acidobacteria bacterium RIFCSPLOWO2_02_FULL_61_28]|nr:MAG: hypothetical protein A3H28_01435 [Acidobacteria bacterium RIFCSPLOWO2_02_FULL_61_28]
MSVGFSRRPAVGLIAALLGTALWGPATGAAQTAGGGQNSPRPVVRDATRTDTSVELRHMPEIPPTPVVLGEIFERPRKLLPRREGSTAPPSFTDPVLQGPTAQVGAPTTGANFDGVNNVNGVLPPDPSGAIGPNHYVQVVNLSLAVWDRSGTMLKGPVNINTLWQGFGGACATTNNGDPIVLYDRVANRWMVSQFALPNYPIGPFYQCIAVSQTGDPLGAWHRYEFFISQTKLNDYPKFGVWPDGYYMAINQFNCKVTGCSWGGQGAVVFERDKMLLGQAAQMVYFDLFTIDSNLGGMLPSDFDGPAPPAGAPNYFVEVDDNTWLYSPDQLQIWEFHVDWSDTAKSSFTHTPAMNLSTAAFDSNLCGYSRNCIPQQGTNRKVDAISDRLMYRLQYRNFGTYQALVTNHTVDVNGADRAGIRWYELRNPGSGWSINQQGTYSPDSTHRWMGSIAMNKLGDIALGYSKSSTSVYPSIYATGRLSGDAAGVMTQAEIPIQNGSGSQTHTSGRWGDYSHMTVDPADDCTFWYTQEYYATTGSAPWRTRIGSFQLRNCGGVHDVAVTSVTAPTPVLVSSPQTVTVGLANQGTESETFNVSLTDSLTATITGSPLPVTLAAGASTTVNFGWTPTVTGSHVLTATATLASDTDTADNSNSATSTVRTPGDVAVTSITAPTPVIQGTSANVSVNVANQTANSETFTVSVTDTPPGGGTAGAVSAPQTITLAGSSSTTLNFTWNTTGATPGSHSLTAAASTVLGETDTADNSNSTTSQVDAPGGSTTMHVGDLDGSKTLQGLSSNWTAQVTITIHDSNHDPVSNATVSGNWSGGASGSASCTSDGTGKCTVSKGGLKRATNSVTLSVSGVSLAPLTYSSIANHDPDGDSNGTSITVTRP